MARMIKVKIQRRLEPDSTPTWESFEVPFEDGMNVTTILQRIAAKPVTTKGQQSTPVAYDACCLEEICGACSMVINGRVRQACSALVENILAEQPGEIELRPMTKFQVVRDLVVDRTPMFEALKQVKAWVPVDGYHDLGTGPIRSPAQQEEAYPLSKCMTCGCCLEACPQYNDATEFVGAAAVSQAILFNSHPTGAVLQDQRLDVLAGPEGIANCGNAQNCVQVCPKDIPLLDSIGKAGRDTTLHKFRQWFGRR
jgi:succinate dehydrogenase / fumarate reductase iron-sulfur subunit